jgi:hypothetical protein
LVSKSREPESNPDPGAINPELKGEFLRSDPGKTRSICGLPTYSVDGMTTVQIAAEEAPAAVRRPRVSLWALRIVATALALLLVCQPILIGGYLSGRYAMLSNHGAVAGIATLVVVVLLGVTISYVVAGGRWWVLVAGIGFVVGVELQSIAGYARGLQLHIPLGVTVVALGVVFCLWSWTPRARLGRRRRSQPSDGEAR